MSLPMTDEAAMSGTRGKPTGLFGRLWPSVALYGLVIVVAIFINNKFSFTDYVGPDNDDSMRLVEVRDFLNGQGWFDMVQHRMGLNGGTLMHWSRLIDLPIASLVRFFSFFTANQEGAEAMALTVWPLFLCVLFLGATGLGARRAGGISAMHIGLGLACLFTFTCIRYYPGAADHHNVQMVLMMTVAAMLIDRRRSGVSHIIAGLALSYAMAIGAETVPIVAVACVVVALQWAWHGESFGRSARAFGLSLSLFISLAFFATVPPRSYAAVTCDNLSLGFYSLTAIGGAGLFFAASAGKRWTMRERLASLGLLGLGVAGSAVLIAPQCLGNPLGNLDPMLAELWLNNVMEAKSVLAIMREDPASVGGFYAAGLLAIAICIFRAIDGRRREFHLIMLALVGTAWGISLVQVRGAMFSNALSILPLTLLIDDLRRRSHADPENANAGLAYILGVLASVPAVWAVGGVLAVKGTSALSSSEVVTRTGTAISEKSQCGGPDDMQKLASFPTGVVAAPSNNGAFILRYTPHHILAAPYHRNQGGMLTELHIGLAKPSEAEAFLRGAGVTILAYCHDDGETLYLARMKPDGLYASLAKGKIPDYLYPLPNASETGTRFFAVLPPRK
ncbi:hypothetical protein [Rhizobium oryzicola]|uniref:GtrA family protein n=1 Tax=Rhizobium oryzicola TaxID=1232668 RepID=A0ABT8SQF0_9HYPH|nr:hypothetical protein [Rhizobium oryzicola]MDO1580693.1 hypothetical protein [Rhizobium oryzicola]